MQSDLEVQLERMINEKKECEQNLDRSVNSNIVYFQKYILKISRIQCILASRDFSRPAVKTARKYSKLKMGNACISIDHSPREEGLSRPMETNDGANNMHVT